MGIYARSTLNVRNIRYKFMHNSNAIPNSLHKFENQLFRRNELMLVRSELLLFNYSLRYVFPF